VQDFSSERFNQDLFLSTSQVAELLGVHPSTVKRWSDAEDVRVRHTEGGHRRIHLNDAVELAGIRDVETFLDPFSPFQGHVWRAVTAARDGDLSRVRSLALGWVHRGRFREVRRLFETLADDDRISLPTLMDRGIRDFMRSVGREWREGRLRVGDEHQTSQVVMESLLAMRPPEALEAGAAEAPRPVAVVGSTEGDQHHLGSLAIRVLLERSGWDVAYLGPDVPLEEFADQQRRLQAELVSVSVSAPSGEGSLRRAIRVLARLYDPGSPHALALGGPFSETPDLSDEPRPFRDLGVFRGAEEFAEWLRTGTNPQPRNDG